MTKQYIAMLLPAFYIFPTENGDYGVMCFTLAIVHLFLSASCLKTSRAKLRIGIINALPWLLLLLGTIGAWFLCAVWFTGTVLVLFSCAAWHSSASLLGGFSIYGIALAGYSLSLLSLTLPVCRQLKGG